MITGKNGKFLIKTKLKGMSKLKKITVGECFTLYIDEVLKFINVSDNKDCSIIWNNKKRKRTILASFLLYDEKFLKFRYVIVPKGIKIQRVYKQRIELTKTTCNYGGNRYWFYCPNK